MEDVNAIAKFLIDMRKFTKVDEVIRYLRDHGGTTIRIEGNRIMHIEADNVNISGALHHVRVICTRLPQSGDAEILVREFSIIERFNTPNGVISRDSIYNIYVGDVNNGR